MKLLIKKRKKKKERVVQSPEISKHKSKKHELCLFELKGHSDCITSLSFDPKGLYLMTTSKDRTVRIWPIESFKENLNKVIKLQLYATASSWSSSGKAILVALEDKKIIEVHQLMFPKNEKEKFSSKVFKQYLDAHDKNIHSIVSVRNYFVTCSGDTILKTWDFEEGLKDVIDSKQIRNHSIAMSRSLEYLALATTMGVRLYKFVNRTKELGGKGEVAKEKFELSKPHLTTLTGYSGEILSISFLGSGDSLVTASNNGTWDLWNIKGDYKRGFQPRIINQVESEEKKPFSKIAVSHDDEKVAVVCESSLLIYKITGELLARIDGSHVGSINGLSWSLDNKYIATGDDSGSVRIFKA